MQTQLAPQPQSSDAIHASQDVHQESHATGNVTVALLALASTMAACGGGGGGGTGEGAGVSPVGANEELLQSLGGLPGSGGKIESW